MIVVTRFDTTTRPANEAEGLDEREVVRLFDKRKLVGEYEIEYIVREDWQDSLPTFLTTAKDGSPLKAPRSRDAVISFLDNDAPEEDEDEEADSGSVVPEKYRIKYGAPQNCGDEIALALTDHVTEPRKNKKNPDGGLDKAKLAGVAEANGVGDKLAAWQHLNGGLQRMNVSNVLRGMHRRGEAVTIGEQTWPAREVEKKVRKRTKTTGKTAPKAKPAKK